MPNALATQAAFIGRFYRLVPCCCCLCIVQDDRPRARRIWRLVRAVKKAGYVS